jgi:hypothetical protein
VCDAIGEASNTRVLYLLNMIVVCDRCGQLPQVQHRVQHHTQLRLAGHTYCTPPSIRVMYWPTLPGEKVLKQPKEEIVQKSPSRLPAYGSTHLNRKQ